MGHIIQIVRNFQVPIDFRRPFVMVPLYMGRASQQMVAQILRNHGITPSMCFPAFEYESWAIIPLRVTYLSRTPYEIQYLYQAKLRGDTVLQV